MTGTLPSPRRIAGALAVLQALPPAALAALAERLIDRLDVLGADPEAEPDEEGEGDDDREAAPWDDDATWTPTAGPADCGPVLLAGVM